MNTIRGLSLDPRTLAPRLGRAVGGYSGGALRPIALACVHACASAVDVPIVGMGGVSTGLDALELVAAGASAVALGTILFSDPFAPGRVRAELGAEAVARGFEDPLDARFASVVSSEKYLQIGCERYRLIRARRLLDSCAQWSRRRRTPRHQPAHSISGWKPFNVRTTSACGVRS